MDSTPSSNRTKFKFSPPFCASFIPNNTACIAPAASVSHAFLNCSALIPAVCAHTFIFSLPNATLLSISDMIVDIAVPPASASIPTLERLADIASIWSSVIPICVPAPAIRIAIFIISASVVAELFPSATSVSPKFLYSSAVIPVIFANCASSVDAVSASKLVDISKSAIIPAKFARSSAAIPSCPPSSITPNISSCEIAFV